MGLFEMNSCGKPTNFHHKMVTLVKFSASFFLAEMTEKIPSNDGEDVPDNKYESELGGEKSQSTKKATPLIPDGGIFCIRVFPK